MFPMSPMVWRTTPEPLCKKFSTLKRSAVTSRVRRSARWNRFESCAVVPCTQGSRQLFRSMSRPRWLWKAGLLLNELVERGEFRRLRQSDVARVFRDVDHVVRRAVERREPIRIGIALRHIRIRLA